MISHAQPGSHYTISLPVANTPKCSITGWGRHIPRLIKSYWKSKGTLTQKSWNEQGFSIQTLTCSTWERGKDTSKAWGDRDTQEQRSPLLWDSTRAVTAKHHSAFSYWCSWASLIKRCLQGYPLTPSNPVLKYPRCIFLLPSPPFAKELHSQETKKLF